VVTTPQGKGAISDRHPLSLGLAELRYAPLRAWLEQRDAILAIGTRTDFARRFQQAQIIQIDIDEAQIGQASHILGIPGDAFHTLKALSEAVIDATPARPSLAAEVASLNAARFDPTLQLQPQWDFMRAIRTALPDDGIFVQGMNQMGYYSRNYFPVYAPRTYLTSSQLATLGAAFPLALGAKLAQPARAVVAIEGDGGFLYNAQELATAVQYGIHIVVVVFNDNAYGNVLRAQIEQFDGHILGTQLRNPDFVQLASAYGARGVRAHDASQLEAALREALAISTPTLIEVPVGMMKREY
jgi:acetolactate synthase-1/2/3 large subunit